MSATTWEQKRGLIARLSQNPDAQTNPALAELRRDLKAQRLEEYIAKVVDSAPPLTVEQRDRIAAILRGGAA